MKEIIVIKKGKSEPCKSLSDDQRKLVEDNLALAMNMGKRYAALGKSRGITVEELQAYAQEGLCAAAMDFKNDKGTKFQSFAYTWCRKYIQTALKSEENYTQLIHNRDDEDWYNIADDCAEPFDDEDAGKDIKMVKVLLKRLGERERTIIRLFYGITKQRKPLGLKEIGRKINLGVERVRQIFNKAKTKMEVGSNN